MSLRITNNSFTAIIFNTTSNTAMIGYTLGLYSLIENSVDFAFNWFDKAPDQGFPVNKGLLSHISISRPCPCYMYIGTYD